MYQCEVCKKESGNGIMALVKADKLHICSKCIVMSDEPLAKRVREIMRTSKKSYVNGVIIGKAKWAAYWTPDCETPKFRKVR